MQKIFEKFTLGNIALDNRIVMAPMTRGRATEDGTPTEIMADYYRQRSSAGLIISEATAISRQGRGWLNAPGIYNDNHIEKWLPVTNAVHANGGKIFLQLWHMGRVSHPDFLDGELPVGPSEIAAQGESHTKNGKKPYVMPRALKTDEIGLIVQDYVSAARNAINAGFDGVEIHAANGYLIDQFLRDGSNKRTDSYGGSVENRIRLLKEVLAAVTAEVGSDKTGVRISPTGTYNDMQDSNPEDLFSAVCDMLNEANVLYLHVMEPSNKNHMLAGKGECVAGILRKVFKGNFMLNGGLTGETAEKLITEGKTDLVSFGVPFIANPNLVSKIKNKSKILFPNFDLLYTNGPEGYTDYPAEDARPE